MPSYIIIGCFLLINSGSLQRLTNEWNGGERERETRIGAHIVAGRARDPRKTIHVKFEEKKERREYIVRSWQEVECVSSLFSSFDFMWLVFRLLPVSRPHSAGRDVVAHSQIETLKYKWIQQEWDCTRHYKDIVIVINISKPIPGRKHTSIIEHNFICYYFYFAIAESWTLFGIFIYYIIIYNRTISMEFRKIGKPVVKYTCNYFWGRDKREKNKRQIWTVAEPSTTAIFKI